MHVCMWEMRKNFIERQKRRNAYKTDDRSIDRQQQGDKSDPTRRGKKARKNTQFNQVEGVVGVEVFLEEDIVIQRYLHIDTRA